MLLASHPSGSHFDMDIEVFLAAGADKNAADNDGATPIFLTTRDQVVKMLLAAGADANIRTKDGKLPIDIAREKGYHKIVELCLRVLTLFFFNFFFKSLITYYVAHEKGGNLCSLGLRFVKSNHAN